MTRYNKLIRDRIPEIILAKGGTPVTHIADEAEYAKKLTEKLEEEVAEYLQDRTVEELADIIEVVLALAELHGTDRVVLEMLRAKKAGERGAFSKRIILEES